MVGGGGHYLFNEDGSFLFAPADGSDPMSSDRGTIGTGYEVLLLLGEDGTSDTIYLERVDSDRFVVITSDVVKYDLLRDH